MSLVFSLGLAFRRLAGAPTTPPPPAIRPVNAAVPVITGSAVAGQTLTASPGVWANSPTGYAYVWRRGGTAISGATAAIYTLQAADVGETITVQVIASNAGGASAPSTSSATAVIAAAVVAAPVNSTIPSISGTATQGQTLSATAGTWANSPTGFAYVWRRGGVAIVGATAATYVLQVADVGATLTVQVTASNAGGASAPAISAATVVVTAAPVAVPVNSAVPVISGSAIAGQTLTAGPGVWTNSPTGYAYVWRRGGVAIVGAVAATYVLQVADVGATLTVQVTASNAGGASAPAISAATVVVTAGGGPAVLPYVLLDGIDNITGKTSGVAIITNAPPVVQGTGSVEYYANNSGNAGMTITNIGVNEAPTNWDVLAYAVDFGEEPYTNQTQFLAVTITTGGVPYAYRADTTQSPVLTAPGAFSATATGVKWRSFAASHLRQTGWTGAPLTSAPAGTKSFAFQTQHGASDFNSRFRIDALVRPQRHKPIFMINCDDINAPQFTRFAPILQARGLVATSYAMVDAFGAGKITVAQALEMKNTYGWAWCLDGGRTGEPSFRYQTVAEAVAVMKSGRDSLVSMGLGTYADGSHVCASFGAPYYGTGPQTRACTGNGTATVTISGNSWSFFIMPGMVVKGSGLAVDPVVQTSLGTTFTLSQPLPTGSYTLTFCSNTFGIITTCNGTAEVTCTTTALFVGQTMKGRDVPANTRIIAVGAASVTVSNPVPATCQRANFHHVDGAFYGDKMDRAMHAEGFKSYRTGPPGGTYTGFGVDQTRLHQLNAVSLESSTAGAARAIAVIQQSITDCTDLGLFTHYATTQSDAHAIEWCDFLQARVAAGDCDVMTVPQWWNTVTARAAFA